MILESFIDRNSPHHFLNPPPQQIPPTNHPFPPFISTVLWCRRFVRLLRFLEFISGGRSRCMPQPNHTKHQKPCTDAYPSSIITPSPRNKSRILIMLSMSNSKL